MARHGLGWGVGIFWYHKAMYEFQQAEDPEGWAINFQVTPRTHGFPLGSVNCWVLSR